MRVTLTLYCILKPALNCLVLLACSILHHSWQVMADSQVVPFLAHEVAARYDDETRCCTKTLEQRVLDRDKHFYKQLWTKDAHGGPYRKVMVAAAGGCLT